MAAGDIKWFADGLLAVGNKAMNLSSDTLKLGIVTTATVDFGSFPGGNEASRVTYVAERLSGAGG